MSADCGISEKIYKELRELNGNATSSTDNIETNLKRPRVRPIGKPYLSIREINQYTWSRRAENARTKKSVRFSEPLTRQPLKTLNGNKNIPRATGGHRSASFPGGEKKKKKKDLEPESILGFINHKRNSDGRKDSLTEILEKRKKRVPISIRTTQPKANEASTNLQTKREYSPVKEIITGKTKATPSKAEEMGKLLELEFPHVDPEFLRKQCNRVVWTLDDITNQLRVREKLGGLPSREDYERRMISENLQKQYWEEFTLEKFVRLIPDPWTYFNELEDKYRIEYSTHSFYYLKNKFRKHYNHTISEVLKKKKYNLYQANKELSKKKKKIQKRVTKRTKAECEIGKPSSFDIHFMHEVAFIEHEEEIKALLKKKAADRAKKLKEAEENGSLLRCDGCAKTGLLEEDTITCSGKHIFCRPCVVNLLNIVEDSSPMALKCIIQCDKTIPPKSLQKMVNYREFEAILKTISELMPEDKRKRLTFCCYCYQVFPEPSTLVVTFCPNPQCKKEYCRLFKQLRLFPINWSLNQNLKPKVKDGPLSPCTSCKEPYEIEEFSGLMICSCGSRICPFCRQPFPKCLHFDHLRRVGEIDEPDTMEDRAEWYKIKKEGVFYFHRGTVEEQPSPKWYEKLNFTFPNSRIMDGMETRKKFFDYSEEEKGKGKRKGKKKKKEKDGGNKEGKENGKKEEVKSKKKIKEEDENENEKEIKKEEERTENRKEIKEEDKTENKTEVKKEEEKGIDEIRKIEIKKEIKEEEEEKKEEEKGEKEEEEKEEEEEESESYLEYYMNYESTDSFGF